jgi:hypothetical protein
MPLPSIVKAIGGLLNEQNIEQVIDLVEKLVVLGEQLENSISQSNANPPQ